MMKKVIEVYNADLEFDSFEQVNPYFKRIINSFKQMNYSEYNSEQFKKCEIEIQDILGERLVVN
jgi:V/A-type H+-transporting ATPase subunit A